MLCMMLCHKHLLRLIMNTCNARSRMIWLKRSADRVQSVASKLLYHMSRPANGSFNLKHGFQILTIDHDEAMELAGRWTRC